MQEELKKKSEANKPSKYLLGAVFLLLVIGGTYEAANLHFKSQFRIIYNLDQKQDNKEIIKIIDGANRYVYFAIFTFTLDDVAQALIRAKQRCLVVWGITDAEQSKQAYESGIVKELQDAGVTIETQKHPDGIMHIKAVVTDKAYAMGSYNWTKSATIANDELLEIGANPYLREQYLRIIQKILLTNQ